MGGLASVSIIIVNWNCEELIFKQIQLLRKIEGVQIIIVDNSDSFNFEHSAIEVLSGHGNLGFGKAINLALARVVNDSIVLLNPDVDISVGTLDRLYLSWKEIGGGCVLSPLSVHSDGTLGSWGKKEFPSLFQDLKSLIGLNLKSVLKQNTGICEVSYCSGACWLISKQILEEYNGFDPDFFLYFEETELAYRLQQGGVKSFIDTNLVYKHDESQTMGSAESKARYFIDSKVKFYLKTKKLPKLQLSILAMLEFFMYIKSLVRGRPTIIHLISARYIIASLI